MSDSVVFGALQQGLYNLLDADADITSAVFWGYDPDRAESEAIFVGFEEDEQRDWPVIRGGVPPQLDGDFRNQIVVEVRRASGRNLQTAYDRASAIAKEVEKAINADVTIGGVVRQCRVSQVRRRYFRDGETRGARLFLDVTGEQRFQPQ